MMEVIIHFYGPSRAVIKAQLKVDDGRMTDIHKVFCLNLKRIRAKSKHTQESASVLLKTGIRTYQRLEDGYKTGTKWPTPNMVKRLAKAFKCDTMDFFKPVKKN